MCLVLKLAFASLNKDTKYRYYDLVCALEKLKDFICVVSATKKLT